VKVSTGPAQSEKERNKLPLQIVCFARSKYIKSEAKRQQTALVFQGIE